MSSLHLTNDAETARALLEAGDVAAMMTARDKKGWTPLLRVVSNYNVGADVVRVLVEAGDA